MLATGSQYLVSTHEYLAHQALEPHEKVWLTRDDVADGIDTVVKAAKAWITEQATNVADNASGVLPTPKKSTAWPNRSTAARWLKLYSGPRYATFSTFCSARAPLMISR
jgi:hypothetical protein